MSTTKTPRKTPLKPVAKVKARMRKQKAESDRKARALSRKVRKAMPEGSSGAKGTAVSRRRKLVSRHRKSEGLLDALKHGIEIIGESIMPSPKTTRSSRARR